MAISTVPDVIAALQSASNKFQDSALTKESEHPDWGKKDVRITVFAKCRNASYSALIGMACLHHHLRDPDWWREKTRKSMETSGIELNAREFENFCKVGLAQLVFSSIESSVRTFLRALDPKAASGATKEFKGVYDCLFKKLDLKEWAPLLDLYRELRNTIHNNGVYLAPSGSDKDVPYKGRTFTFEWGKLVNFVTWELILEVICYCHLMLEQIVEKEALLNITSIPDPSAV